MDKCISFSIFDHKHDWQFLFYIRGLVLNVMMIKTLEPETEIEVQVERSVFVKYAEVFTRLHRVYGVEIRPFEEQPLPLAMLYRLRAIYTSTRDYVFCRDADSLVTERDLWIMNTAMKQGDLSTNVFDNPAHGGYFMGGMCGFNSFDFRIHFPTFENLLVEVLKNNRMTLHGDDQDALNSVVYPRLRVGYAAFGAEAVKRDLSSDLCVAFIGAAGFNEMETLRWLRDHGVDLSLNGGLKLWPREFYWA